MSVKEVSSTKKRTDNPPENRTDFKSQSTPPVDNHDYDYDRLMYDPDGARGVSGRPTMIATKKTLIQETVPPKFRDYCSHLLIDLNKCRKENFHKHLWWNRHYCDHQQTEWYRCEYQEYLSTLERRWWQIQDDKERGIRNTFRGIQL